MSASAPGSTTTSPTAVGYQRTSQICRVTVHQARGLLCKSRSHGHDAYVIMSIGRDKYQTSVVEKTVHPHWDEQCDLHFSNTEDNVELQVFHRNKLLDDFLGYVAIPIRDIEFHGIPIRRWHKLHNKRGKKDAKERGEIEVTVSLTVDMSEKKKKKRPTSFREVASVVGSKFQLSNNHNHRDRQSTPDKVTTVGSIEESLPLTKELTISNDKSPAESKHSNSKENVELEEHSCKMAISNGSITPSSDNIFWTRDWTRSVPNILDSRDAPLLEKRRTRTQSFSDIDQTLSATLPAQGMQTKLKTISEDKLYHSNGGECIPETSKHPVILDREDKLRHSFNSGLPKLRMNYVQVTFDHQQRSKTGTPKRISIPKRYTKMSKEDLLKEVLASDRNLNEKKKYIRELEDYIDNLLLKVIVETPRILDVNYHYYSGTSSTL
uniref:Rab11 family-interacting protein 1-like isoform X2 n=1 Tax=Saccoglossus kowalevskii TaxID=10224 RepID=A0ABM0M1R7_SACKO|nr:PREDICTED: rab11 family-interacting protein 1-like isoform X2 [Saccoglossus kowalevskii]